MNKLAYYMGWEFGEIAEAMVKLESAGPLTETEYWNYRNMVMKNLVAQYTEPMEGVVATAFHNLEMLSS